MRKLSSIVMAVAVTLVASQVYAGGPTVNGTLVGDESSYGSALSVQNTATQFGDAIQGDQVEGFGSEIDQVFATVSNGRLNMLVTGNLEWNFNKLNFFFDTVDGGHNQIVGANLPTGVDGFCCGGLDTDGGALQRQDGLTFDAGFEADYFLTVTHGVETALDDPSSPGNPITFWAMSAHYSDLTDTAPADRQNVAAGMQLAPNGLPNVLRMDGSQDFAGSPFIPDALLFGQTNPNHIGPPLPNLGQAELIDRDYALDPAGGQCTSDAGIDCLATELGFALDVAPGDTMNTLSHRRFDNVIDLQLALDNSNVAGVEGSGSPPWETTGDPENVVTGVEFSIPLSELGLSGNEAADIDVVVFVNGSGHHYASNQIAGEGILQGNLGGDGMGEFTEDLSGVNFATIDGDQFVRLSFVPPIPDCDFDASGSCDINDIDMLVAEIVAGTNDPALDLNGDDQVTLDDVTDENVGWLRLAGEQEIGPGLSYLAADINLDTFVDGQDFIEWNANKFETTGLWSLADLNADGFTDGQDFIIWNGLKFMSSNDGNAVPEPSGILMLLVGTLLLARRR